MKYPLLIAALAAAPVLAEPTAQEISGMLDASQNLAQRCDWDIKVYKEWTQACDAHLELHNQIAAWGPIPMTTWNYRQMHEIKSLHFGWKALGYLE